MSSPVKVLKSLSDRTRLRILLLIELKGDLCVCELSAAMAESQPKISQHLARLRTDCLVEARRQGKWVYYRLAPIPDWTSHLLASIRQEHLDFIIKDVQKLDSFGSRPDRLKALCP